VTEGSAIRAVRYLITGRVQGVFYRAATVERASALSLDGWARNLPDGRVEVVAAGTPPALANLAAWLWEGPPAARVEAVQVEPWPESVSPGFAVAR
jgi:acylphosphatase